MIYIYTELKEIVSQAQRPVGWSVLPALTADLKDAMESVLQAGPGLQEPSVAQERTSGRWAWNSANAVQKIRKARFKAILMV